MARRSAAEAAPRQPIVSRKGFRLLVYAVTLIVGIVLFVYVNTTVEQFLISDTRFALTGPPEPGIPSAFFRIDNAVHASEQKIAGVFARDFGRSIYLCPIAERRRKLLAIDWVKDATVSRFWPNRIVVNIKERTPVAFVQTAVAGGTMTFSLLDDEGVLLDLPKTSQLALPVLTGVPARDSEANRRERVKLFLRMQSELGAHMKRVSEIDVGDVDNLKVVVPFDNRAITLMLGNQSFRERLEKFLDNVDEIRQRMPGATILDVRLKGRITAGGQQ